VGALYLALISFVALYAYVGTGTYNYKQSQAVLAPLDHLLALRRLTEFPDLVAMRPARMKDLPHFFSAALQENLNLWATDPAGAEKADPQKPFISKFNDDPIANSQIAMDVPMRMAVNGACDVFITQLGAGESFDFITILIVGEADSVKSENVKLATFHGCLPGPTKDIQALILQLDNGQYAFAIPRSLEEAFLGSRSARWFQNYPLEKPERITRLLPEVLRPYVEINESMVFLHGKAIDYLILSFANLQLGKRFAPEGLDTAIQQLYEQKEKEASYLGINASGTQLIRTGPLIYFFLSIELWRRVRRLPKGRVRSSKYWFAFETPDWFGHLYAYGYALLPLFSGVLIYSIFVASQGLGLVLLGHWVTWDGLMTLTFPPAPGPGWYSIDGWAVALLFFLPFQFLIAWLISLKLVQVVKANLREDRAISSSEGFRKYKNLLQKLKRRAEIR
jgi:hypothetical protein